METPICDGTDLAWECCMSMFTAEEYYAGLEAASRDGDLCPLPENRDE